MSSISVLEEALTDVFESSYDFDFGPLDIIDSELLVDDVREIRTDLSVLAMNRPSTKN